MPRRDRRLQALRIVGQLHKISRECYVSPYGLAQIYAALNDKEQTFKWLQSAYESFRVAVLSRRRSRIRSLPLRPPLPGFATPHRSSALIHLRFRCGTISCVLPQRNFLPHFQNCPLFATLASRCPWCAPGSLFSCSSPQGEPR